MKGALILDKCSQPSYEVRNGIAYFLGTNIQYQHVNHLGGLYAPPFMNFPYVFDEGYLLKLDDFPSIKHLPNLDLDIIILSLEKVDYSIKDIRKKYPNAKIIGALKEFNPVGGWGNKPGHLERVVRMFKEVDVPTMPYSKKERFFEFEKIIGRELVHLRDPIDVDYLYNNYYGEKENVALCYVAPTHRDRGQRETFAFCNFIEKEFGVKILYHPFTQPYDHSKRMPFPEFINYINRSSFCVNFDKWYGVGQCGLHCASLGTIHIGGTSDSNLELFPETSVNDPKKLKSIFEDLYFNMDNRVNYIQKVFQQINSKYSLSVIKQRIKEL